MAADSWLNCWKFRAPATAADSCSRNMCRPSWPQQKSAIHPFTGIDASGGHDSFRPVLGAKATYDFKRLCSWRCGAFCFFSLRKFRKRGSDATQITCATALSGIRAASIPCSLRSTSMTGRDPRATSGHDRAVTGRDLINVEEICAASPRIETIIFGPADFAASMEMPVLTGGVQIADYPGDHFHYVFNKILMAGRANGLQVIDGPYLYIRDNDGFRDYCKRTRTLGYDGKWALHPDQVTVLNEVFSPTQEQFDRACAILDAYETATEGEGKGAVMFGDEMIDEASRKMALKFISRGKRAGLSRSK
ncbi:MAG: hypothetical protein EBV41_03860 [Actinobacteria bacterium]|nr:hypothetical protein [Actinomycetota bacterium]